MPKAFKNHPKSIQHTERYGLNSGCIHDTHFKPSNELKCPKDWNTILQCQDCKHNLCSYLGQKTLEITPGYLEETRSCSHRFLHRRCQGHKRLIYMVQFCVDLEIHIPSPPRPQVTFVCDLTCVKYKDRPHSLLAVNTLWVLLYTALTYIQ